MSASKSKLEELLAELHEDLTKQFLKEVQSNEASPATLNAARQFLKDNGITMGTLEDDEQSPFEDLVGQLVDEDELDQARLN